MSPTCRDARRRANALLANAVTSLHTPPSVVVAASGVGFYGSSLSGDAVLDETAVRGGGFLAEVAAASEAALAPATAAGVRVVYLRLAPVLDARSGMLGEWGPARCCVTDLEVPPSTSTPTSTSTRIFPSHTTPHRHLSAALVAGCRRVVTLVLCAATLHGCVRVVVVRQDAAAVPNGARR